MPHRVAVGPERRRISPEPFGQPAVQPGRQPGHQGWFHEHQDPWAPVVVGRTFGVEGEHLRTGADQRGAMGHLADERLDHLRVERTRQLSAGNEARNEIGHHSITVHGEPSSFTWFSHALLRHPIPRPKASARSTGQSHEAPPLPPGLPARPSPLGPGPHQPPRQTPVRSTPGRCQGSWCRASRRSMAVLSRRAQCPTTLPSRTWTMSMLVTS